MRAPESPKPARKPRSALRGLLQLALQATHGVAHITEATHQNVWRSLGSLAGRSPTRTRGLTGWVYRSIHTVIDGVDWALVRTLDALPDAAVPYSDRSTPLSLNLQAALCGVLGDRLQAQGNALALPMTLQHAGQTWVPGEPWPEGWVARPRVLLALHGLCMHDGQWTPPLRPGQPAAADLGVQAAAALDATPLYLRYNSGLPIAENGRQLSALLSALVAHWPLPLEGLSLMGHSMGGLVARAAVHHADQSQPVTAWRNRLCHMVFLGSPHQGAPLEQAGHGIDWLLHSNRWSRAFEPLARLRSAGITDLRHGCIVPRARTAGAKRPVPEPVALPNDVACFAVAACLAGQRSLLADRLVGDGLVPLRSALGQHRLPQRRLHFAPERQWVVYRTGHLELLYSPAVARQVCLWLAPPAQSRAGA